MKSGYNNVAFFYDKLSKLVFADAIKNSQIFLLNSINEGSKILIAGGGTGWILEEIAAKYKSGLQITYIDISEKMIGLAEKRNAANNEIIFINKSILNVEFTMQYDVVITPFFLDNFSAKNIDIIIDKINDHLINDGIWLHADFVVNKNNFWQKALLKIMYMFFKITCNIEANSLAETKSKFESKGFKIVNAKNFYSNFICSIIYKKDQIQVMAQASACARKRTTIN